MSSSIVISRRCRLGKRRYHNYTHVSLTHTHTHTYVLHTHTHTHWVAGISSNIRWWVLCSWLGGDCRYSSSPVGDDSAHELTVSVYSAFEISKHRIDVLSYTSYTLVTNILKWFHFGRI